MIRCTKMIMGEQPLPRKNSSNLKVSVSPMGFFRKSISVSRPYGYRIKKCRRSVAEIIFFLVISDVGSCRQELLVVEKSL